MTVALGALLVSVTLQQPPADAAAAENYGQYSLMTSRSAGQIWARNDASAPASQWAWRPTGDGNAEIRWDDPANWDKPATNIEHFAHRGDWVYLDGWEDRRNGVYYTQRVTSEQIGDGDCDDMEPLASDGGRQHYVRWDVPAAPYCLLATGTITNDRNDIVVNFTHRQIWSPARNCVTRYHGEVRCIRQSERWADDNGHPMRTTQERHQYLGKGLGMGLIIEDRSRPATWHADLRDTWTW